MSSNNWAKCDQRFRRFLMASVEDEEGAELARWTGWRYFRTRLPGEPLLEGEFQCPAAAEAGHRLQCDDCMACWGSDDRPRRACPSLEVHGALNKRQRYVRLTQQRCST